MSRAIVRIEDMGGSHPVQAEGHMLIGDAAYPFYFRFRGDRAQMTVWQPGAPHNIFDGSELAHFSRAGVTGNPYAGALPDDQTRAFIDEWAAAFAESLPESLPD